MSRRKIPHIACILLLILISLQVGCTRDVCSLPPEDTSSKFPALSNAANVDVYIDATLSMQGFIVPGTVSYYQQTLPLLESAVEKGWPQGQVIFYKFGTRINKLAGRGYLEATRPGFYNNEEVNKKTFIENVIDSASTEHLTVIVTDLFQDNADVNLLTQKLKDKYIANNLAIGIIGIKSEFSGAIYDVGINNYKFDYKSNADPNSFRPFYVLLLGKHPDVAHYFEMLDKSGLGGFPAKNFVIFSSYMGDPVANFNGSKITPTNNIVIVNNLLPIGAKEERVRQFRVRDTAKPSSFTALLKSSPLSYTPVNNVSALTPEVTAWKCEPPKTVSVSAPNGNHPSQGGKSNALSGPAKMLVEVPNASAALQIKNGSLSGSDLKFEAEIAPASLPGDGIYCFRVILRPQQYPLPEWVSEWDMNIRQIEEWKRKPQDFNGSTTFNLAHFLGDLWDTVIYVHHPKVADFYCYVQK